MCAPTYKGFQRRFTNRLYSFIESRSCNVAQVDQELCVLHTQPCVLPPVRGWSQALHPQPGSLRYFHQVTRSNWANLPPTLTISGSAKRSLSFVKTEKRTEEQAGDGWTSAQVFLGRRNLWRGLQQTLEPTGTYILGVVITGMGKW